MGFELWMNGAIVFDGNEEQILGHIQSCSDFLGGIAIPDKFEHPVVLDQNVRGDRVRFPLGFICAAKKLDFLVGHSSCPFPVFRYLVVADFMHQHKFSKITFQPIM